MNTKLTLRMEEKLINIAKSYAKKSGKSVSQLVADFFSVLESTNKNKQDDLSPKVKSLKGIMSSSTMSEKSYKKHLEEKYL